MIIPLNPKSMIALANVYSYADIKSFDEFAAINGQSIDIRIPPATQSSQDNTYDSIIQEHLKRIIDRRQVITSFQTAVLSEPIIQISPKLRSIAIHLNGKIKAITSSETYPSHRQTKDILRIKDLLDFVEEMSKERPELIDELYAQLIKETNNAPYLEKRKAVEIIVACLSSFSPSKALLEELKIHLSSEAYNSMSLSRYNYLCLTSLNCAKLIGEQTRRALTRIEIECLLSSSTIYLQVQCAQSRRLLSLIQPWTTVDTVIRDVLAMIEIDENYADIFFLSIKCESTANANGGGANHGKVGKIINAPIAQGNSLISSMLASCKQKRYHHWKISLIDNVDADVEIIDIESFNALNDYSTHMDSPEDDDDSHVAAPVANRCNCCSRSSAIDPRCLSNFESKNQNPTELMGLPKKAYVINVKAYLIAAIFPNVEVASEKTESTDSQEAPIYKFPKSEIFYEILYEQLLDAVVVEQTMMIDGDNDIIEAAALAFAIKYGLNSSPEAFQEHLKEILPERYLLSAQWFRSVISSEIPDTTSRLLRQMEWTKYIAKSLEVYSTQFHPATPRVELIVRYLQLAKNFSGYGMNNFTVRRMETIELSKIGRDDNACFPNPSLNIKELNHKGQRK